MARGPRAARLRCRRPGRGTGASHHGRRARPPAPPEPRGAGGGTRGAGGPRRRGDGAALPQSHPLGRGGDFPLGPTNPHGLSVGQTVVGQVGLEQEFLLWGKRGKRIAQARARADAAEATRADLERTLAFTLRSRFTDVLITTRRLALAQENLAHYRETVRVSEARARTGEISPADLDKIMLEQRAFEREVADAEVDRRQAVAELLPLVGLDATDVDAVGELAVPPVPDDAARLTRDALARRPDLRAAERA